jgi:hypothetical protein
VKGKSDIGRGKIGDRRGGTAVQNQVIWFNLHSSTMQTPKSFCLWMFGTWNPLSLSFLFLEKKRKPPFRAAFVKSFI